jgi:hypothetical protein
MSWELDNYLVYLKEREKFSLSHKRKINYENKNL